MIEPDKEAALYWLLTLDRKTGKCWSYGPYDKDAAYRYMMMRQSKRFFGTMVQQR